MLKANAAAVTAVVIFRIDPSFSVSDSRGGSARRYVASLRWCSSANARTFPAGPFPLTLSSPPYQFLACWPTGLSPEGRVTRGSYPYRTLCGTELEPGCRVAADLYHRRPIAATGDFARPSISRALDERV